MDLEGFSSLPTPRNEMHCDIELFENKANNFESRPPIKSQDLLN